MKKIFINRAVSLFLIIIVIMFGIYWFRTNNFALMNNMSNHKEIFDYPNSEWVCENPEIELRVYDLETNPNLEPKYALDLLGNSRPVIVKVDSEETPFVMIGGRGKVSIFDSDNMYDENGVFFSDNDVFWGNARYKRDFYSREVTSFIIYKIIKDEIFDFKYKKMVFTKQLY